MVKNPNRQEADQLANKRDQGVELGAPEKQLPLAVRAGIEPGTSRPRCLLSYFGSSILRIRQNNLLSV